jgi:hypothetical protein
MPDSTPSKNLPGTTVASSNQPTQAQATRRGYGATLQASSLISVPIPTLSAEAAKVLQNRKTKQAGMTRGPGAVGGGKVSRMAGVQVVRAAPKVFSPLYENSNLQLPRDLRTLNAWCISGDTKILTEGWIWKAIETLEIGDLVYTHTGILAPIKAIASRVANSYYEVRVRGEQKPVKITGEHVVKVLSFKENQCVQNHSNMCTFGNKKVCHQEPYRCRLKLPELKIREKCLDQCSVGDYTFFPIPQKSEQGIWNKDFARLLGFYLAEGTSTEGCPQVGLTFNINEKQYIEEAANLFEKCFGVRGCIWESEKDSIARVYTTNEKAREFLVKHGGRGTKNKKLSQEVLDLPAELQGYIIGAYIDGDGYQWSSEEKKTTEQTSVDSMSSILVQQLQFLFWRNEINAYLYELKRICTIGNHIGEEVTYWRLGFGKTASNKLVKYSSRIKELSATKIRSDRFFYQDKLFTKIESITKVDQTLLVYDLTIDHDDHSFVTSLGAVNNCRHFYNINPLVRNAINLHATYPISKFNLECEDKKILHFFEDMFEQLNMPNVLHSIALEYWKLGEAIPQAELDPNNGVWQHLFLHNPDYIRVQISPLAKDPIITLIPDEHLKRIVTSSAASDAELKRQLPPEIIALIQNGLDIPLNNFNVSHLKMLSSDYDVRGSSIISACYKDLMLYDKLREAEFVQADDMVNPITHVKLGDPNGCYSEDTEILTENGFKKYNEVEVGEKLATFNSVSETIEYQDYTDPVIYYYDSAERGEMYNFVSKETDVFVTPNHNMFVNENALIQAKDLTNKIVDFLTIVELVSQKIELSVLKRFEFEMKDLKKIAYKGYVWCFSVPNRILITRRNGMIAVQGNSWKPDDTDISDMRQAFEEAMYDLDFKLVTHGAVSIEKIGNGGAVLDTSRMWDQINKNILIGLMAPEEVINGNGASYASATVGLEVLRSRYERFRNTIDAWTRRKIMEPIAKIQDFYKWEHGRRRLIVPKIVWNKMNLRDVESYLQNLTGLVGDTPGTGRISARTLFNILDIDPDSQITETRRELIEAAVRAKEQVALAKMSVEELLTLDHNKPITDKHPTASPSSDQSIPGETDESGGEGGGGGGLGDLGLGGGGGGAPSGLGDLGLGDLGGGPTEGGPSEGAPTPDLGGLGG